MGICGASEDKHKNPATEKTILYYSFERGNEEQRAFGQRMMQSYRSPIEIEFQISDTYDRYYLELRDMGRTYPIQNGGFVNTDNMINTLLNQINQILFANRKKN